LICGEFTHNISENFEDDWMNNKLHLALMGALLLSGCQALHSNSNKNNLGSTVNVLSARSQHARSALDRSDSHYQYIWDRIADNMELNVPTSPDITEYRDWYIQNPKYLHRLLTQATPYINLITDEVDKRELPMELVLLPFIESGYNPNARSRGNAVGLWQFLAPSADRYGLKRDYWYDGRKDVSASTTAALNYLAQLNAYFNGDWYKAIAAYNAGEGRVMDAVQKNQARGKSTDFFALNLPRQTVEYVPRLLALADIIKHARAYGVELPKIPARNTVKLIDTQGQIDLRVVADEANISLSELKQLNPGFSRTVTSPNGPNHLLVPVNVADDLEDTLAKMSPNQRMKPDDYTLMADAAASTNPSPDASQQAALSRIRIKVKSGDTLSSIAKRYSLTTAQVKTWNHLGSQKLHRGQVLVLNVNYKTPAASSATANSQRYHVRRGDSLYSIAQKFQVSVNDLVRWNSLEHHSIRPGQTLNLQ
jgi:membrane-bound lytic murein transglycosylase D